jgi:hypothetical protein
VIDDSPCNPSPELVYRAYSPDGLSEMRSAPRFDWTFWTTNGPVPANQCPPLRRTLNASEFAKYYAGIMGATLLGPMSVGFAAQQRIDAALAQRRNSPIHPEVTGGIAAERIVSKNGTFQIEERLLSTVICSKQPGPLGAFTQCHAFVQITRAPKGRLDALVRDINENKLGVVHPLPAYQQRLAQWMDAKFAAMRRQGEEDMRESSERLRSSFEHSMALQRYQHEQFMAQMQSATNASMNRTAQAMNARSTAASDWTDYALDQQTVTGSGGTVKVSSAYSQTWSNGQGQWYQTNNPNAQRHPSRQLDPADRRPRKRHPALTIFVAPLDTSP